MAKQKRRARKSISKLRLKQRMLLVYFLGCFLPLLCVYIYMYIGTRNALMEQEYNNEATQMESQVQSLENNMLLAEEFAEKLYYDNESQMVGIRQYAGNILVDYRTFDELYDYTESYYPYISNICVYLLEDNGHIDNRCFKLITGTIRQKNWYQKTIQYGGKPYWSYMTDVQIGTKSLRLTKALYDKQERIVGVVSVALKREISESMVSRSGESAYLLFNGTDLVHASDGLTEEDLTQVQSMAAKLGYDGWVEFRGERCLVAQATVELRYGDGYYSLVAIKPYNDIVALANKNAIGGLLPLLVGMLVSTLAIIALSNWFLKRINSFSTVMHAAAVGDFEVENTEIGQVHDEIWDLNNDLNQMIQDIKALMEAAAEERVQKEQIYSRQKEVEFKMLATQINPHFLYNTLENIRMLARINKQPEIEDISVTLTRLLRRSLSANHEQVTLLWEMETAEYYIRIQNYRFGDRIRAELTYDKEQAANYLILPFVVQPFVENAYVHAMEDKEADGLITVRAEITDRLVLTVEDNGQGMDQETLAEITRYINDFENLDRTHIGICNVNQRIKLKFGDEYGVDFESEKGVGTKVQITIPLVTSDGNIQ